MMASALAQTTQPSVIWLSFQECTGCTESLSRSFDPTLEELILGAISLDYHHTLQVAAGNQAEDARRQTMQDFRGQYVLVVDGAVSTIDDGAWSTIAGESNLAMLRETAEGAALILSIGSCSSFGGLPAANPNPTMASGVEGVLPPEQVAKLINVPGCPPLPEVIGGVVAYYLTYGTLPELDEFRRPTVFYGATVHEKCPRKKHYDNGRFATAFDDDKARKGQCLYMLGCRGPYTKNSCNTLKWNGGTSSPVLCGHGCIGCSERGFWDMAGGFYGA